MIYLEPQVGHSLALGDRPAARDQLLGVGSCSRNRVDHECFRLVGDTCNLTQRKKEVTAPRDRCSDHRMAGSCRLGPCTHCHIVGVDGALCGALFYHRVGYWEDSQREIKQKRAELRAERSSRPWDSHWSFRLETGGSSPRGTGAKTVRDSP